MKPKLILCLALILICGIFGCSTTKPVVITGDTVDEPIKLPVKFAGYREFFTFVAKNTYGGMSIDADTVFKLAADSTIEIVGLDFKSMPYVYVVEDHYYNGYLDEIRGAQGNGQYYILRPLTTGSRTSRGFELVGIIDGNAYTVQHLNETPRFVSYWHISAGEHPETIYEWNGKFFESKKGTSNPL
jgi:hypothetical protein